MDQQQTKTRGVADIVFLIDISGSMAPAIDALKTNIGTFVESLSKGEGNNVSPVRDWRAKAVGYRDFEHDPQPFIDNPFVSDVEALRAQLAGLTAEGGEDEPESLLDALFKVANMGQTDKGAQTTDPNRWRYRSEAARVVVVFTDASFKPAMTIPEGAGGGVADVTNAIINNRIILSLFAPDMPGYDELSQIDKSEWEAISYPGLNPQEALVRFTSDQANFKNTLRQLAASVSKSAETIAL
jgi:von Willebrand factor type A domain